MKIPVFVCANNLTPYLEKEIVERGNKLFNEYMFLRKKMSGECDKCGEHVLDCICHHPNCEACGRIIYRYDKACMNCLVEDAKKLLENSKKLLKRIEKEDGR